MEQSAKALAHEGTWMRAPDNRIYEYIGTASYGLVIKTVACSENV